MAGGTGSFSVGGLDFWVLKLNSNGDIADPGCTIIGSPRATAAHTNMTPADTNVAGTGSSTALSNTPAKATDSTASTTTLCTAP